MNKFFYPRSMVVIGVSLARINLGKIILLNNLQLGYGGRLYGIGKEEGSLEGIPVFKDVESLPEVPDVAVIITPAQSVPAFMEACGKKGITHIVVETGGFSEFSDEKNPLEAEVLEIASRYGMKLIGPNCVGTANMEINMMMAFGFFKREGEPGRISAITQSGGIGNTLIRILNDNHIFYRKFASVGNKLQLDETDFTDYFLEDPQTEIVLMYLEGFKRGRDFFDLAMKSRKPFVILKSNRSPQSAKIAKSHTAAISTGDDVVEAMMQQSAITRVEGEDELALAVKAFLLPPMKGPRVAVLSRSGGHAVITADACAKYGFDMVEFPPFFIDNLKTIYQTRVIAHQNPLDLGEIFDYTIFIKILEEALRLDIVDGVIFNHLFQSGYESESSRTFLHGVRDLVQKYDKPVAVSITTNAEEQLDISKNHPCPTFQSPLQAATALRFLLERHTRLKLRDGRGKEPQYEIDAAVIESIKARCLREKRNPLTHEALDICASLGLAPVKGSVVKTPSGISGLDIRYPVVVKLISRDASHKSDIGGVRMDLKNADEALHAAEEISVLVQKASPAITVDGFLVQETAPRGEEFFVGGRQDPVFGPIVLAGYGGIFIEIFRDRSICLGPVTAEEARNMLRRLKTYPLIQGVRGRRPLDREAMVDLICRVSFLLCRDPSISEIDLNPVILHEKGKGLSLVDSRVFFR